MTIPIPRTAQAVHRFHITRLQGYLLWLIIGTGVLFRLYHYVDNRSLWVDEAMISLNLIHRDFLALTSPRLDYAQYAPLGFLWAERLLVVLLGKTEPVLRLFPLLCSVASLFLFNKLVAYVLPPPGRLVALACLAFAHPVIYYSVEVKQYQTELLCAIITLLSYFHYRDKTDWKAVLAWGVLGAVLLWFSFTEIFILVGVALVLSLQALLKRNWHVFFGQLPAFMVWAGSFLVIYFVFVATGTKSDYLKSYWADYFLPLFPNSRQELVWFGKTFYHMLDSPLGLNWRFLNTTHPVVVFSLTGTGLLLLGMVSFYQENRSLFWVFICPLLLMLAASGLQKYPIFERFQLFYVPICFLFTGRGAAVVYDRGRSRRVAGGIIAVFVAAVFLNILYRTVRTDAFGDGKRRETRQGILYVQEHIQPGDVVYVHWQLLKPYKYYEVAYGLNLPYVSGEYFALLQEDSARYYKTITTEWSRTASGKRVWLLLSNRAVAPAGRQSGNAPATGPKQPVREADLLRDAALSNPVKLLCEYHTMDTDVYLLTQTRTAP